MDNNIDNMRIMFFERELPELPPENMDKALSDELYKVDWESMDKLEEMENSDNPAMADIAKLWVQIYKLNMTYTTCHLGKLEQMFDGHFTGSQLLRYLQFMESRLIIERQYGTIGDGIGGRLVYIDNDSVQGVRGLYETYVEPFEKPEDRVSYVPGVILEK